MRFGLVVIATLSAAAIEPPRIAAYRRAPPLQRAAMPVMRISDAQDEARLVSASRRAAVGAAIASLLQGYHTGVIGGALLYLTPEFGLATNPKLTGMIVTATTMGSVLGTASAARLADGVGRRGTLLLASWISLVSSARAAAAASTARCGRGWYSPIDRTCTAYTTLRLVATTDPLH